MPPFFGSSPAIGFAAARRSVVSDRRSATGPSPHFPRKSSMSFIVAAGFSSITQWPGRWWRRKRCIDGLDRRAGRLGCFIQGPQDSRSRILQAGQQSFDFPAMIFEIVLVHGHLPSRKRSRMHSPSSSVIPCCMLPGIRLVSIELEVRGETAAKGAKTLQQLLAPRIVRLLVDEGFQRIQGRDVHGAHDS